jgi:hypothetical protein
VDRGNTGDADPEAHTHLGVTVAPSGDWPGEQALYHDAAHKRVQHEHGAEPESDRAQDEHGDDEFAESK